MKKHIALLRGINVGGHKKIRMADLRTCLTALDLQNVQTYLQSGNVVFDAGRNDDPASDIEQAIKNGFGFDVRVLLRTEEQLQFIFNNNPFAARTGVDPSKLFVTFLESPIDTLPPLPEGIEDECLSLGTEIVGYCPNGFARTKLTNSYFEQKLKLAATTRNWKTVSALLALCKK